MLVFITGSRLSTPFIDFLFFWKIDYFQSIWVVVDYATCLDIMKERRTGSTFGLNISEIWRKLEFILYHAKYFIIFVGILNDIQEISSFNTQKYREVFASNVFVSAKPCKEGEMTKRWTFIKICYWSISQSGWSIEFFQIYFDRTFLDEINACFIYLVFLINYLVWGTFYFFYTLGCFVQYICIKILSENRWFL